MEYKAQETKNISFPLGSIVTRHPDILGGFDIGPRDNSMVGFPNFRNVLLDATFPMAKLQYTDEEYVFLYSIPLFHTIPLIQACR